MKFQPRPFQQVGIEHAAAFLRAAEPGQRQLYAAPTGVGKSVVQIGVREHFDDLWIVTPRDEIIDGFLDKLQQRDADPLDLRISTPVKLRNRLMSGAVNFPGRYIIDESHHETANTYQELDLLAGLVPAVGYTATPYRGSPKSTKQFLDRWGKPIWLITYQEAIDEGFITMPQFSVLPLVDDDIVEVKGGEFDVTSIESATVDRLGDLADHCVQWYDGKWDKATIFSFSSSLTCEMFKQYMDARGLPTAIVSAKTPKADRPAIFQAVEERILALIHINIVSEGVDLRIRRYVDCDPTMSPVEWVQKLGRITRPTVTEQPEYICTNRNIMRHAYVLDDIVPVSAVADTERLFGPTTRGHSRVLGMEALGRFKPTAVQTLSGCNAYVYLLSVPVGTATIEYCCIVHPTKEPIWATKVITRKEDGSRDWGKWTACESPDVLRGFASKGAKEPSPKQQSWWERAAARVGLDPNQEVNRRTFTALPVLADLQESL